jgi:hypothetical protein
MFFDDVTKKFGFEKLFSIITEGMTIKKKNKKELFESFKIKNEVFGQTKYNIFFK